MNPRRLSVSRLNTTDANENKASRADKATRRRALPLPPAALFLSLSLVEWLDEVGASGRRR